MKIQFSIHYRTAWGENLHVVISYRSRDGRERTYNLLMQTQDGDLWTLETAVMESRQHPVETFSYYYQVEAGDSGEVLRKEWNQVKRCYAFDSTKDYILPDQWRDVPLQWHLYTKMVGRGKEEKGSADRRNVPLYRKTIIFRVSAPQLSEGEAVGICGSHPSLGDWNPSRYLRMEPLGDYEWLLSVNVEHVQLPLEYKYIVIDDETCQLKRWEEGDNRMVDGTLLLESQQPAALRDGQVLVMSGEALRVKESTWRAAGVVVPLFALRSEHSFGVGDFGDLRRLADWASLTGMKMIQLLPVNDTTSTHSWTDSHPYNAVSAFALHPHYMDLEQLPPLKSEQETKAFNRQRRELNALDYSDYMAVDRVKTDYINKVYAEHGEETLASEAFAGFMAANGEWLTPYAAFCALRDKFGTSRYTEWKQYAGYDQKQVAQLSAQGSPLREHILKTYFVQYHLHRQLSAATAYAHEKGVVLKGDLPVGIYRDSVEAWVCPDFFRLDMQLGTPPTAQEPAGQNWGFPPYRWGAGEEAGNRRGVQAQQPTLEEWFVRRFHHLEQYFDALRIDHILSFFRAWEIPVGQLFSVMGHFSPSLPLSEEEIGRYGLTFRRGLFTRPFINDKTIDRIFGIHAGYVRDEFLVRKAYNLYELKAEVSTQEKIRDCFDGKNDENSLWIRDGLYRLCADVLFLKDPYQEGMYHPRVGVFNAPVYDILSAEEKDTFMRLYNNYYYERHNQYWCYLAQKKLSAIQQHTRMQLCAEDLGFMPDGIKEVLDSQRILSLEVQRLPKQHGDEFAHLEANPYRSVATISTHDMSPLRLWWEEDAGGVQRYYATMLQKEGRAPRHLPSHIAEEIIARHLYCPSMLCNIALQDWLSMGSFKLGDPQNERINAPYDTYNQWKYRMPMTLESLMDERQFNEKLKTMIVRSKR